MTCSLLGQPYFLVDEQEEVSNARATIATAGAMRRSVDNFMFVKLV